MDIRDKRILVVEDDLPVARSLCEGLRERGAVVLGPAPTPFYALQLLGGRGVDLAILDVFLYGASVCGVADVLSERGIPFIFTASDGSDGIPPRHRHRPFVLKPYDLDGITEVLAAIGRQASSEDARPALESREEPIPAETAGGHRVVRAVSAVLSRKAQQLPAWQSR